MCVNVYYLDLRDQGIKNEHSIQRRTSALLSLQHLLIVTVVIWAALAAVMASAISPVSPSLFDLFYH